MGLDLTVWIEVRTHQDAWREVECADVGRNYALCAALFDMRNSWRLEALTSRRGVPPELSATVFSALSDEQGQLLGEASWLTADEVLSRTWSLSMDWMRQRLEVYWMEQDGSASLRGRDHRHPSILDECAVAELLRAGELRRGRWLYRARREPMVIAVEPVLLAAVQRLRTEVVARNEARLVASLA